LAVYGVIAYAARTGTRRNLAVLRAAGWRLMLSPRGVLNAHGFPYALDNGAWTAFMAGEPMLDLKRFESAVQSHGANADWVVAPDIVMGGQRSLELSASWIERLLRDVPRVLVAVQNGHNPRDIEHLLSSRVGIFVGGDSQWKEHTAATWSSVAHGRGAICHVGRVNTARRIEICARAGVDSFDGSSVSRFAVTLPLLDAARRQLSMIPLMQHRIEMEMSSWSES
jgi:hypothetical protein